MTSLPADLRPDCAACLALCCVSPPFDAVQGFGFDKPARTPCQHLQPDCRCAIHARLLEAGFPGCLRYDCYGAGQRAVREFAAGADWRQDMAGARVLFGAYERLRELHELKAMLHFTLERAQQDSARSELLERLEQVEALCRIAGSDTSPTRPLREATLARLRELLPAPDSPP